MLTAMHDKPRDLFLMAEGGQKLSWRCMVCKELVSDLPCIYRPFKCLFFSKIYRESLNKERKVVRTWWEALHVALNLPSSCHLAFCLFPSNNINLEGLKEVLWLARSPEGNSTRSIVYIKLVMPSPDLPVGYYLTFHVIILGSVYQENLAERLL